MFYACAARFDEMGNLNFFAKFKLNKALKKFSTQLFYINIV